jgi:dienelactone hydrolase
MKDEEKFNAAAIRVENIKGPLLLISGGDDQMWPSALYCTHIKDRLAQYHSTISCEHLCYLQAGHGIAMPALPQHSTIVFHPVYNMWFSKGGTAAANRHACIDSWQKLIAFFDKSLRGKKLL